MHTMHDTFNRFSRFNRNNIWYAPADPAVIDAAVIEFMRERGYATHGGRVSVAPRESTPSPSASAPVATPTSDDIVWFNEGASVTQDNVSHARWAVRTMAPRLGLSAPIDVVWFARVPRQGSRGDFVSNPDTLGFFRPSEPSKIFLNSDRLGSKVEAFHTVAHELRHCHQHRHGRAFDEDDAETFAERMCREFGVWWQCSRCGA